MIRSRESKMKTGLMLVCAVIMWGASAMAEEPWAKSACEKAEKQIVARFVSTCWT